MEMVRWIVGMGMAGSIGHVLLKGTVTAVQANAPPSLYLQSTVRRHSAPEALRARICPMVSKHKSMGEVDVSDY